MKRKATRAVKRPEDHKVFERLCTCGKCGAALPVTIRHLLNGAEVRERRHLCLGCEPAHGTTLRPA